MIPGVFRCQCGLQLTEQQLWSGECPSCVEAVREARRLSSLCQNPNCYYRARPNGYCRRHRDDLRRKT